MKRLFKIRIIKSVHHRYPHIPVWRMETLDGRLVAYWQRANNKKGFILRFISELKKSESALQRLTRFYPTTLLETKAELRARLL